ncbi:MULTISPECIES: tetratricopeptide repeat protein [unclassified Coleofasciculus]|uniref:tetratricopeptide repeat protein n=1 Tax=unclassified Coleofasciculus TaxID=2692782 RepID=UPI001881072E|nr:MULTISPECIES: tetratricopeptide repeat protein [unclassified Coleofasciculus]MBE9129879.1 tetratricopeptide repeat protein [Coleofasciculus sp. LEGE 07081]MBE9152333.1 tetratricopeptide repeat protein [Coleofasciculus sp. LEGE 07092]
MPKHISFFSIIVALGLLTVPVPVLGQALVPYTLQLDSEELEQQGLNLAQDAVQLVRFQQYDLALPRAELATQLAPNSYQTWFILGSLYVQNKEVDKAIEALQRAHSLEPQEAGILFTLGSAHFQKANYTQAIADLEMGLKIEPEVPEALFDLGNSYYMIEQYPQAIATYEKAAAQKPTDSWPVWPAINNMGLVKYEQGDVAGALEKWQAALAFDEEAAEPQLATAVALYTRGERQKGISLGEAAIRTDNRYADLEFLKENLWGKRLLSDTKMFLENPQIQATIAQNQEPPLRVEVAPK